MSYGDSCQRTVEDERWILLILRTHLAGRREAVLYRVTRRGKLAVSRAEDKLNLARRHLERVLDAWDTPSDWDDLSLYGFYCLEAAVEAAAVRVGLKTSKKHWEKADVAVELHKKHGLPNIEQLLHDLNDARKSAAYGDVPAPNLNAEDVASEIERYVDAVEALVKGAP